MIDTVLLFGSFNPVHNGHTALAGYILRRGIAPEVWLVVSPRNPFKEEGELAEGQSRLEMVRLALDQQLPGGAARACDAEFSLPQPSYTINTLEYLSANYPERKFSLLIGTDILDGFDRWRSHEKISDNYRILVYPRPGYNATVPDSMQFLRDAPVWDCSSTEIRLRLLAGLPVDEMVSGRVLEYIRTKGLWSPVEKGPDRIAVLTELAGINNTDKCVFMERGKAYRKEGIFDKALNDFIKVRQLDPTDSEASQYIESLRSIFDYRYKDYYNP